MNINQLRTGLDRVALKLECQACGRKMTARKVGYVLPVCPRCGSTDLELDKDMK